jgi:hypothetical protein
MKRVGRALVTTVAVASLVTPAALRFAIPSFGQTATTNRVLAKELAIELGQEQRPWWLRPVSAGPMYTVMEAAGVMASRARQAPVRTFDWSAGTQGCQRVILGPPTSVRVNQDCSLRQQAEEAIAINPTNHRNLVAGQNDLRIGFNHCGVDWSRDGGVTWGDMIPPFYRYEQLGEHPADACADPTVAFDSRGNAYVGGIVLDISSGANSVLVMKSNAGIDGRFFHNPGKSQFQEYLVDQPGVVASDIDPNVFNDKELMAADWHKSSPKRDNMYMTWTRFRSTGQGVGADSPIFFSQSTDGDATWSPGIEISGSGPFCTTGSGESDPNACDQDQGSHPVAGWDGAVYVAFNNTNVKGRGMGQQLVVSCSASEDCSQRDAWVGPYKISDDYATQPIGPDADTGCPSGRPCLPPNGYRLNDFGAIAAAQDGNLFFTWSDYRNGQDSENCPGLSGATSATPPCNNDVFYSFSTDRGKTWSATTLVTGGRPFGKTAQWQAWGAVSPDGAKYYVGFYDRSHGPCEPSGCNDITLATIKQPASAHPVFAFRRLTASSMPNLIPANNPVQAGFLGDYMWVATLGNGAPYVVWASTDGRHNSVEEDIYFAR